MISCFFSKGSLYAKKDDSYEYSMSTHYDEAISKEVKIIIFSFHKEKKLF